MSEDGVRVKPDTENSNTTARMLTFAERFLEGMSRECSSADHASLYGDDGLPR